MRNFPKAWMANSGEDIEAKLRSRRKKHEPKGVSLRRFHLVFICFYGKPMHFDRKLLSTFGDITGLQVGYDGLYRWIIHTYIIYHIALISHLWNKKCEAWRCLLYLNLLWDVYVSSLGIDVMIHDVFFPWSQWGHSPCYQRSMWSLANPPQPRWEMKFIWHKAS